MDSSPLKPPLRSSASRFISRDRSERTIDPAERVHAVDGSRVPLVHEDAERQRGRSHPDTPAATTTSSANIAAEPPHIAPGASGHNALPFAPPTELLRLAAEIDASCASISSMRYRRIEDAASEPQVDVEV